MPPGTARCKHAPAAVGGPLQGHRHGTWAPQKKGPGQARTADAMINLTHGRRDTAPPSNLTGRILALDWARSLAIVGMIVFHFVRDLEMFGYLPRGATLVGGWPLFARAIAGAFLLLSGVSLVLAHAHGVRWGPWLRRLGLVAGAAALVSLATYVVFPDRFIYFGILHAIALCSVVGLPFLFLPGAAALAAALAVFALPALVTEPPFASVWLAWTGLGANVPPSYDFVPLVPWLAPFLLGMALARVLPRPAAPARGPGRLARALAWPGRHSLAIYLLHQPILFGLFWALRLA